MFTIVKGRDIPDIGYMEATMSRLMQRGIRLANCKNLLDYYANLRETLKNDFRTKYNVDNPNSTKQLTSYLSFLSSQVAPGERNDIVEVCFDDETGKWTSNAEAMEKLSDMGYEFAQDLLDYRHAKKYAESIESVCELADDNGLIHPEVSLAKTHRLNYSKPGLMSIPKKLLWHIIAPYKPGNVLYSVDIKNQEPSILINITDANELKYALESEDGLYETMFKQCFKPTVTANVLIDTFLENRVYSIPEIKAIGTISPALYMPSRPKSTGLFYNDKRIVGIETVCLGSAKGVYPSLPDKVAIELEDGSVEKVSVTWNSAEKQYKRSNDYSVEGVLEGIDIRISKIERKEFKTSWLAISYGASSMLIRNTCKSIDGSRVYKYITSIEAIKKYRNLVDSAAKKGVNCINTYFGNKVFAGDFDGDAKKLRRVLLDLPIQGTGADILALLIRHFYDYTESNKLSDKLSLYYTRHDELIIEVDGNWINEVGADSVESVLKDMMEHQIEGWTPFKVEIVQTAASTLDFESDD